MDRIYISGARQHNLKNITVQIPRNQLTVVTGLSGAGKSSLAFDTLYAEGQRRYVESLSAYARQFLEQLQKPDVDLIEGLPPAISIEQKTASSNPRSTVATATEIHDYLRVFYATLGQVHCHRCGKPILRRSAEEIVEELLELNDGSRLVLLAPVVREKQGAHNEALRVARELGYVRVRIDGLMHEIERAPKLNKQKKHTIEIVVDRLVLSKTIRSRLTDSVELSLRHGKGQLLILLLRENEQVASEELFFSERNACAACDVNFERLSPRHFSFNSPYGACPKCLGLGTVNVFDEHRVIPDPSLSIEERSRSSVAQGSSTAPGLLQRAVARLCRTLQF